MCKWLQSFAQWALQIAKALRIFSTLLKPQRAVCCEQRTGESVPNGIDSIPSRRLLPGYSGQSSRTAQGTCVAAIRVSTRTVDDAYAQASLHLCGIHVVAT